MPGITEYRQGRPLHIQCADFVFVQLCETVFYEARFLGFRSFNMYNDTYLSILVDGFRVQSRGDHGWPPLACGILSSSSDIEGCRAVVSGVIWIRLLDSARLM